MGKILRLQSSRLDLITLTEEFFKDLNWFPVGHITFYHLPPLYKRYHLDASLEGLGGSYDNYVYS